MKTYIALITCLICIVFINIAVAQDELQIARAAGTKRDTKTYNLVSLDGKTEKVKIVPDYVNHVLRMSCSGKSINITDFWGVTPEIHTLNKNFIEIKYAVRGGTNLGLGNTLILCVNGGKLYEAMHVLRYANWDSGELKMNYNIKLNLTGNNISNYQLNMAIHDDVNSKPDPEHNYNYNNQTVLSFDTKQNAFYSVKKSIYNYHLKTRKSKQRIDGNFPVIILGKETYYYINDRWCKLGDNQELSVF
ncbi:MAG: hypothetical protein V4553_08300 [Bacteroidota bacterium]